MTPSAENGISALRESEGSRTHRRQSIDTLDTQPLRKDIKSQRDPRRGNDELESTSGASSARRGVLYRQNRRGKREVKTRWRRLGKMGKVLCEV